MHSKYKNIILIIFIMIILLVPVSAFAHSGRTDSNGGHWDHSTGEYHYHHGYPAHQHPNGECPYAFSNDAKLSDGAKTQDDIETEIRRYQQMSKKSLVPNGSDPSSYLPYIFLFIGVIFIIMIVAFRSKYFKLKKEICSIRFEKECVAFRNKEMADILEKNARLISNVPSNIVFSEGNLPHTSASEESFIVYVYQNGTCFHFDEHCSRYHAFSTPKKIHMYTAITNGYYPCTKCSKGQDTCIPQWYINYINIIHLTSNSTSKTEQQRVY